MLECAIHPITYRGEGILATIVKELMTSYQKLILENQVVLEELDMEC